MRLAETQAWFWDVLRGAAPSAAAAVVRGTPRFTPEARLAWYAEMSMNRQLDALALEFPAVAALLGNAFVETATRYVHGNPARHASLDWSGDRFAHFLRREGQAALGALAELEWARERAFVAPDSFVAPVETLMSIPPESFATGRLTPVPSLQRLQLDRDPLPTWRQHEEGQPLELPRPTPVAVAVWRKDDQVFHNALAPAEAEALDRVLRSLTLGEVCDSFGEGEEAVPLAFAALASWFNEGWIAGVQAETPS